MYRGILELKNILAFYAKVARSQLRRVVPWRVSPVCKNKKNIGSKYK